MNDIGDGGLPAALTGVEVVEVLEGFGTPQSEQVLATQTASVP